MSTPWYRRMEGAAKPAARYVTWPERLAATMWKAATLPGDVYAGRVDPLSQEGIERSADLAGALTLGSGALPAAANEARMGIKAYHGSSRPVEKFEPTPSYRQDEMGRKYEVTSPSFFFTPDRETAQLFAKDRVEIDKRLRGISGSKPHVGKYDLDIENPLDLVEGRFMGRVPDPEASQVFEAMGYSPMTWEDVHMLLDDPMVVESLRMEGYDAVRLLESNGGESWAVFDPAKIKAAKKK